MLLSKEKGQDSCKIQQKKRQSPDSPYEEKT